MTPGKHKNANREHKKKLVYITSTFPVLRETFISREIIELEKREIELIVVSLKNKPQEVGREELPQAPILYLPFLFSLHLLAGAARTIMQSPAAVARTSWRILWELKSKPSRSIKFLAIMPKSLYLVQRFKKENVRHLHAHFAAESATCAYFISKISGLSFSFTAHAWDIYAKGTDLLLKEKMLAADLVITISEYNRRYLISFGVDDEKVKVFYQGLELERYPFVETNTKEIPLVMAGGGLEAKKGVDVFVRALAVLKQRGVQLNAKIFGDGEEKEHLMQLAWSSGLEDTVSFVPSMPHRDAIRLFQQADIFVMAAVRAKNGSIDGLPNVLAEAMACGATVVASDFSGIPELVRIGEDGVLFPPGDANSLADALAELCGNPDLRARLSRSARKRVEDFFDLRKNILPLESYFRNVIDRAG